MQKPIQYTQAELANRSNETLFQNFYLFGIEPYDLDISDFTPEKNYLAKDYTRLKLLSKFPPKSKPQYQIDDLIIMNHCFPKGYKIIEKEEAPKDEFFFFSFDNLCKLNPENKKIYFTVAIIFEPISLYLNIKYNNKIPPLPKKSEKTDAKNEIYLDKIYIQKALCFSMVKPFPYESKNLIKELLDYFRNGKITIPLEKIIESIIYGIPRPLRAYFYISCKKTNEFIPKQKQDIDFSLREFNEYSFSSYAYQLIFILSINDIFTIYKCLLLEIPILFFCSKKEILTNIVDTFINLLHPFEFQYPYTSMLPDSYCGLIETQKCFVFGINHKLYMKDKGTGKEPKYFKEHLLNVENKLILFVDLDDRKIYQSEPKNMFHVVKFDDLGVYPEGGGGAG